MSNQFTLTGKLIENNTNKPLPGFTVNIKTSLEEKSTVTDALGIFSFPNLNEPPVASNIATYKLQINVDSKDGYYQEPASLEIGVVKGSKTVDQLLKMVNRGPISNSFGKWFLGGLILGLIVAAAVYGHFHKTDNTENVNSKLVKTLTESLVDRITDDSIKVSGFKLQNDLIDSLDSIFISREFLQIEKDAKELANAAQSEGSIITLVDNSVEYLGQTIKSKNGVDIQQALDRTKANIKQVPNFLPSWFWTDVPGKYFEILFWALFATLLRLIGNTSYYVSRSIFFKNSWTNKLPLLLTIPLIALLITFVISFFQISISLGGTVIHLDFSNPFVSIILASLIGLAPWKSWDFMYGLADQFIDSLNRWLGLNNKDNGGSQNGQTQESQPAAGTTTT